MKNKLLAITIALLSLIGCKEENIGHRWMVIQTTCLVKSNINTQVQSIDTLAVDTVYLNTDTIAYPTDGLCISNNDYVSGEYYFRTDRCYKVKQLY